MKPYGIFLTLIAAAWCVAAKEAAEEEKEEGLNEYQAQPPVKFGVKMGALSFRKAQPRANPAILASRQQANSTAPRKPVQGAQGHGKKSKMPFRKKQEGKAAGAQEKRKQAQYTFEDFLNASLSDKRDTDAVSQLLDIGGDVKPLRQASPKPSPKRQRRPIITTSTYDPMLGGLAVLGMSGKEEGAQKEAGAGAGQDILALVGSIKKSLAKLTKENELLSQKLAERVKPADKQPAQTNGFFNLLPLAEQKPKAASSPLRVPKPKIPEKPVLEHSGLIF